MNKDDILKKIQKIKQNREDSKNTCNQLQKERQNSFESDEQYLVILEKKLKEKKYFKDKKCKICLKYIEKERLKILPETDICSLCEKK